MKETCRELPLALPVQDPDPSTSCKEDVFGTSGALGVDTCSSKLFDLGVSSSTYEAPSQKPVRSNLQK